MVSKFNKGLRRNYIFLTVGLAIICCLMSGTLSLYLYAGVVFIVIGNFSRLLSGTLINNTVHSYVLWLFLVWLYICINGFFITEAYFGWKSILTYLLPAIGIIIFYSPFKNRKLLFDIFCKGCVTAAIILIGYITVKELPAMLSGGSRIGDSASGNVNTVAMHLCVFAAVVLYQILFQKKKNYIFLLVLNILFILLTGSKKGIIGICVVMLILHICKFKWKIYKYSLPICGILMIYYLVINNDYFYGIIGYRLNTFFETLSSSEQTGSTGERIRMYKDGWEYFKQSIFWGNGYGYFSKYSIFGTYSHNNYIEMLVSFGIVGTGLYYSYFLFLLKRSIRNIKVNSMACLFLTLIILQLFFDTAVVSFYNNALMYVVLFFASKILT